jgi:hypothetical protein
MQEGAVRATTVLFAVTGVALAVASSGSFAASTTKSLAGQITVRSWEKLKSEHVTDGGVVGTGRFKISGVITDAGTVTSYRREKGRTVTIRRVTAGKRGSITFRITITINDYSPPPWVITSATPSATRTTRTGLPCGVYAANSLAAGRNTCDRRQIRMAKATSQIDQRM